MIGFQTIGNATLIAYDGEPKAGARFTAISGNNFHFGFRVHGFALGEKNPMGKSRAVRKPAGASRITGIEFTTTEAVAMSPCEPPGITRLMFGCPVSEIVSAGSFAPRYICSSRYTSSLPSFERPRAI